MQHRDHEGTIYLHDRIRATMLIDEVYSILSCRVPDPIQPLEDCSRVTDHGGQLDVGDGLVHVVHVVPVLLKLLIELMELRLVKMGEQYFD